MPNDRFYRIDTALLAPVVDTASWSLRIYGMVDRETTLTYEDLIGLPMFEQYVTISCVSNEVGGDLVGNAKWTGVRLREVLAIAGVQAGATQLIGGSVDGWTAGMPTAWVMDPAREPMIAVKMNDEPLPVIHGFPARLIIPGLYGYVSATKWLSELELTTLEAFDGYWVPLGWAKEAPILTQSRIDTPRCGTRLAAGRSASPGSPGRPIAGSARSRWRSTATWRTAVCRPRSRTRRGSSGSRTGTRRSGDHDDPGPGHRRHRDRPGSALDATRAGRRPRAGTPSGSRSSDERRAPGRPTLDFGIESGHDPSSLHLRPARALRRRHRGRARQPDVLPAGPRRRTGRQRGPREGPGRGPGRAARSTCSGSCPGAASRPPRPPRPSPAPSADAAPLDEPINEAFRAGSLTLGWDTVEERVLLEARALDADGEPIDPDDDDDEDEDGPDLLRVRISAADARAFVERAARVVAGGRPPCPLCGAPLDPQGHICPRRNGHYVN